MKRALCLVAIASAVVALVLLGTDSATPEAESSFMSDPALAGAPAFPAPQPAELSRRGPVEASEEGPPQSDPEPDGAEGADAAVEPTFRKAVPTPEPGSPPIEFPTWDPSPCQCPPPPPPPPLPPPVPGESSCGVQVAKNGTLQWLKSHQMKDGSFGGPGWGRDCGDCCLGGRHALANPESVVSRTSLALLTFMSQGTTHRFGPYKRTVSRGIKWLKKRQQERGSLVAVGAPRREREQSLGALALCEAYWISRDFTLERRAQAALDRAIEWHLPLLGTRAGEDAWLIEALYVARAAKLEVPAHVWKQVRARLPLQASGDLARDALALIARRDQSESDRWRARFEPLWSRVEGGALVTASLDDWVHVTHAVYQAGGPEWERYGKDMTAALLRLQCEEGCLEGTMDPALVTSLGRDRLVATHHWAYMLELNYRYERSRQE